MNKFTTKLSLAAGGRFIGYNTRIVSKNHVGINYSDIYQPGTIYFNCPFSRKCKILQFSTIHQNDTGNVLIEYSEKYDINYEIDYSIDYSINSSRFYSFKQQNEKPIPILIDKIKEENGNVPNEENIRAGLEKRGIRIKSFKLVLNILYLLFYEQI